MFKTLFIIFSLSFFSNVQAWTLFGPKNYDDCVLDNVKSAQNQQAVSAIKEACSKKFRDTAPPILYDCYTTSIDILRKQAGGEAERLTDEEINKRLSDNNRLWDRGMLCKVQK